MLLWLDLASVLKQDSAIGLTDPGLCIETRDRYETEAPGMTVKISELWLSVSMHTLISHVAHFLLHNSNPKASYDKSDCHKLLHAMMQLQLIAIDNSDVNPPEEVVPDGLLHQQVLQTTDSENHGFHL